MKRIAFFSLLAAIILSSCSYLANSELSRAQSRWQAANIKNYTYQLHVGCFCAFTQRMPLTIEVKDGQVQSMSYQDGSPVSAEDRLTFAPYQTIDALFDFTSAAIGTADEVKAEYDATYGYPAHVQIDRAKNAADDEMTLEVSSFQQLP
jgi:hypothetical protein